MLLRFEIVSFSSSDTSYFRCLHAVCCVLSVSGRSYHISSVGANESSRISLSMSCLVNNNRFYDVERNTFGVARFFSFKAVYELLRVFSRLLKLSR